ncbi:MAG: hypothetical protein COW00_02415 [Bdellovibrio sp. CG12_big_fil_rev_8_21_14_0_65_39_13]|nr:MAG: hypothetical protein COW78_09560 [Bdellovibrio sp. CG22_combo_CG10-13_8_21_14_all_39_27]PIQ62101.1 MAG: hypothetical protein COW00_02415 [Bdellovibrio sp. CG12_big_fil_rev_8_21_14_0_65_39_13]PIR32409.1 MAG: hypothetical protein COV37_20100 [Bdellovibrio sp. CG11_big_fil_rev_8_21_14_0_20_39_38]PJB52334.1 MAG: hypothetical protein CO099_13205 [Bdellovibrio sp. CG_4_9_14_3_um_filter_39_7]
MNTLDRNKFVLHVDDEVLILKTYREIFENSGFQVDSFVDPVGALDAIKDSPEKYSLVVSDYNMAPMNGIDFFKELKAHNYFGIKYRAIISGEVGAGYFNSLCRKYFDLSSEELILFSKTDIRGLTSFLERISYQYPIGNEGLKEFYRLEKQALMKGYRPEEDFILEDCLFEDGQNILDAGCGSGVVCRMLALLNAKKSINIHGIEISKGTAELAQKRIEGIEAFSNIEFQNANLEEIPHPDSFFDVIICRYVYEHMARPQKITDELFRVLKPGGILIVVDTNGLLINIRSAYYPELDNYQYKLQERGIPNFDFFINDNLPAYLNEAGFEVDNCMSFRDLPILFNDDESRLIEKTRLREVFENAQGVLAPVFGGDKELGQYVDLVNSVLDDSRTKFKYDKRVWKIRKS